MPGPARAAVCAAAKNVPTTGTRDALLARARSHIADNERPEARAIYLALLARDPSDDEVRGRLARLDAWDGCYDLAEKGYRQVLSHYPEDAEVRAGLVDVLLWTRRWDEAEAELEEGVKRSPGSPDLVLRRAKLAHWRGDEERAAAEAARARRLAPLDLDAQALCDEVFLGEARLAGRAQLFPSGWDDIYTTEAEISQRWRKLRFFFGHQSVARTGAFANTTTIDVRRTVGVYYHAPFGGWVGAAVGVATPGAALPLVAVTLSALSPIGSLFTLLTNAAVWQYTNDKTVYTIAPSLGWAATPTLEIGARWWVSNVVARAPGQTSVSETVHSIGLRAVYRPEPSWQAGAEYTYGVQLDQNPTFTQLLELRSHVVTVYARRMFFRELGVQPVFALERRESLASGVVIVVPLVELALLTRW